MTWREHLTVAEGYFGLGMYQDAHDALELIAPEDKTRPEVFGLRAGIYHAMQKWDLCAAVAGHLTKVEPKQRLWWSIWAYATRRSESVEAAEQILIQALTRFPEEAILFYNLACYTSVMGRIREAKSLLAEAISLDHSYRLKALDDEDLRPLWEEIASLE